MASTSGTTVFNLDLVEMVEEAFERCGSQSRTGYDLKTARRSLNLMLVEWANRGINLWTVEENSIILNPNQGIYAVPVDTVDILDLETVQAMLTQPTKLILISLVYLSLLTLLFLIS